MLLRHANGTVGAEACVPMLSRELPPLMVMLNESHSLPDELPAGLQPLAGAEALTEEVVERLLYDVHDVAHPTRRRAAELPRAYNFAFGALPSWPPPPPLPPPPLAPVVFAPAAPRSVFGWAGDVRANAALAACICAAMLLSACVAYGLGVRNKVRSGLP